MESRLLEPHRAQRHAIEVHKHLLLCVCVCVCLCMVCVRCNFSKYMIFKYMYVELGSAGASKGQIAAPDAAGDATALGPLIHFFFCFLLGIFFSVRSAVFACAESTSQNAFNSLCHSP